MKEVTKMSKRFTRGELLALKGKPARCSTKDSYEFVDARMCIMLLASLNVDWSDVKQRKPYDKHITDIFKYLIAHNGELPINNDSLCIDVNGIINNGVHRLLAILKYIQEAGGKPVAVYIRRGCPVGTYKYCDTEVKKRNLADLITMEGDSYKAGYKSSILTMLWIYQNCLVPNKECGNPHVPVEPCLKMYHELKQFMTPSSNIYTTAKKKIGMARQVATAYAIIAMEIDPDAAERFYSQLLNPVNLDPTNPILEFREWLSLRSDVEGTKHACTVLARVIQTFNAWKHDERLEPAWRYGIDDFPVPTP
jgi:hypothetical protein